jgi:hypothetical protein
MCLIAPPVTAPAVTGVQLIVSTHAGLLLGNQLYMGTDECDYAAVFRSMQRPVSKSSGRTFELRYAPAATPRVEKRGPSLVRCAIQSSCPPGAGARVEIQSLKVRCSKLMMRKRLC